MQISLLREFSVFFLSLLMQCLCSFFQLVGVHAIGTLSLCQILLPAEFPMSVDPLLCGCAWPPPCRLHAQATIWLWSLPTPPLATKLSSVVSDVENVPGSGFSLWIYSGSPIGNCYKGKGCWVWPSWRYPLLGSWWLRAWAAGLPHPHAPRDCGSGKSFSPGVTMKKERTELGEERRGNRQASRSDWAQPWQWAQLYFFWGGGG